MSLKFSIANPTASVEAVEQDLVCSAVEALDAAENLRNLGVECTELETIVHDLEFARDTIKRQGIRAYFYSVDSGNLLANTLGLEAYKPGLGLAKMKDLEQQWIDGATEGLGDAIGNFFKKIGDFIRGIIDWIKNLFKGGSNSNSKESAKLVSAASSAAAEGKKINDSKSSLMKTVAKDIEVAPIAIAAMKKQLQGEAEDQELMKLKILGHLDSDAMIPTINSVAKFREYWSVRADDANDVAIRIKHDIKRRVEITRLLGNHGDDSSAVDSTVWTSSGTNLLEELKKENETVYLTFKKYARTSETLFEQMIRPTLVKSTTGEFTFGMLGIKNDTDVGKYISSVGDLCGVAAKAERYISDCEAVLEDCQKLADTAGAMWKKRSTALGKSGTDYTKDFSTNGYAAIQKEFLGFVRTLRLMVSDLSDISFGCKSFSEFSLKLGNTYKIAVAK